MSHGPERCRQDDHAQSIDRPPAREVRTDDVRWSRCHEGGDRRASAQRVGLRAAGPGDPSSPDGPGEFLLGFWARSDKPNGTVEKTVFDEVYHLFPKLTQILNRPGGVLSGGEQQQLAIGRAILSNPKLLLLDEPTEGIQPSIVDQIEDVIIGFKNSRRFAILLVEQGLHFAARLAEKYVVMAKGAVVVSGKSNELSAEHGEAAFDGVIMARRREWSPARATRASEG